MSQDVFGEFIGTFVLILFGAGVGCSINLKKTLAKVVGMNWVLVAFGWGIGVMLGVYSAAHFGAPGFLNPALAIAFAIKGTLASSKVVPYIIAEIMGAFLGSLVTAITYWPHFKETGPDEGNSVGIFATGPAIPSPLFNFLSEVLATFAFVFTLLLLPGKMADGLTPLILAFLFVGIAFSFGSMTGYACNPARDFGPRLMYTLIPLPNKNKNYNWQYVWVPICGPIVGAVLAVLIVHTF